MTKIKTKFHKVNPWTGESLVKQKLIDVNQIQIGRKPLPAGRCPTPHKYEAIFSKLTYGDTLTVPSEGVGRLAAALRHYLKDNKKPGVVRSSLRYPGDEANGCVWYLEG